MGNARAATAKVAWDNAARRHGAAVLQRRLRRPEFMASIDPLMRRFVLHARMQQLCRMGPRGRRVDGHSRANVMDIDRLRQLQDSLDGPMMDDEALCDRLQRNYGWLERWRACQRLATEHDAALRDSSRRARGVLVTEPVDLEPLKLTPSAGLSLSKT
jgi:hypothetical protein